MESAGDEPLAPQFADVTQVDEDDVLAAMQSERLLDADGFGGFWNAAVRTTP